MPIPEVGDRAPAFNLKDQQDQSHKLSDYKGKYVVLYFYPKDDTPGCTKEACAFRDDYAKLKKAGAVLFGVSPDDTKSHAKFAKKFDLPFPLLADDGHALAEKYGVWAEKSMYGKTYWGVARSTFLIDKEGKIAHVWPKVKVDDHSEEVLTALQEQA
jgi:peroxiredoxin Q/BCP